jgi:hypothetical protein
MEHKGNIMSLKHQVNAVVESLSHLESSELYKSAGKSLINTNNRLRKLAIKELENNKKSIELPEELTLVNCDNIEVLASLKEIAESLEY